MLKKFVIREEKLEQDVLPLITNKVFHFTRLDAFKKILAIGHVLPSGDGQQNVWTKSFSKHKNYISFFDLRNKSNYDIENSRMYLDFVNPPISYGNYIAYLVLSEKLHSILVDLETAKKDPEFGAHCYIPGVECWFPYRLSIENISEVFLVEIIRSEPCQFAATVNAADT